MSCRILLFAVMAPVLLGGLTACGKQGDLARPAPLFGKPAAVQDPSAQDRREEEGARINGADDLGRPRDPGAAPPTAAPVNVPPTRG
jgi:hypothetical protein